MTKADAIRKIKALRARALRGGSAEECSTAAATAFRIMEKHGVTEDDLRETVPPRAGEANVGKGAHDHDRAHRSNGAPTPHVQAPPPTRTRPFVDGLIGQFGQEFSSALADGLAGFREEFEDGMRTMGRRAGGRR